MRKFIVGLLFSLWSTVACANVPCSLPFNLLNGTTADATQVMADYNAIITCLSQAAIAGANNDITSLTALSTPLAATQGGTTLYIGGTSTGTANAQTLAVLTPTGFGLTAGASIVFKAGFTNTGAATFSGSGSAATAIFVAQASTGPVPLGGGEIQLGQTYWLVYDGTQYILMNPSPFQGTRTCTSAPCTVVNADNQRRIVLGGGAFFTVTFNAVAGYSDSKFWVDVINSDTTAAKLMSISGGTNFYLYPGQIKRFFINGAGAWGWTPAFERWRKGGAQLFADIANGNDNNDCLASGAGRACQHICAAVTRLYNDIDNQNAQPTVNVAATGTYTESCSLTGQVTGVNVINIVASGALTWKPNGTSPNLFALDNAEVILTGAFTLDNSAGSSGVTAMATHQTGVVDFNNGLTFGTYSNGTYMACDHGGGSINIPASFTINGTVGTVLQLGGACSATWSGGGTLTVNGGSTCSTFLRVAGSGANMAMGTVGFSGAENGGCTQYVVSANGTLGLGGSGTIGGGAGCTAGNLNVAAFGGTGGSCTTGGQTIP